jgi:hypothetical protein
VNLFYVNLFFAPNKITVPANHQVTVILSDGKSARATVTYLQPKAER